MTKAQEKRNKQFRESLTNRLRVIFNPFRNYNYQSYVNSKVNPHKNLVESHWGTYSDVDEAFEALKGKTFGELDIDVYVSPYGEKNRRLSNQEKLVAREIALSKELSSPSQLSGKLSEVKRSRGVLDLLEVHRLNWLTEVKEAFDNRFDKMLNKMCNSIVPKGSYFTIEVEELSNSWNEFEVLIHVEETTFHARAIWVNGVQMISHYRFVTTTRKNK